NLIHASAGEVVVVVALGVCGDRPRDGRGQRVVRVDGRRGADAPARSCGAYLNLRERHDLRRGASTALEHLALPVRSLSEKWTRRQQHRSGDKKLTHRVYLGREIVVGLLRGGGVVLVEILSD